MNRQLLPMFRGAADAPHHALTLLMGLCLGALAGYAAAQPASSDKVMVVTPRTAVKVHVEPASTEVPTITGTGTDVGTAMPNLLPVDGASPYPRIQPVERPALNAAVAQLLSSALGVEEKRVNKQKDVRSAASERAQQAKASWTMGLLYIHGIGVPLNPPAASAWFQRAFTLGEPLAAAGLAWCAIDGCKAPPDAAGAKRWLIPLRVVNMPRAEYMQWLIEAKLAPLQMATRAQLADPGLENAARLPAKTLLLNAAQHGDVQANIELGFDSLSAGYPAQALEFFKVAAPRSTIAATNAELVSDIITVMPKATPDTPAPGASQAEATLAQARRNHRGEGQPANFVEAIRLYRLAQSQGSQTARKILELIFSRPGTDGQLDIVWMQQLAYVDVSGTSPVFPGMGNRRILQKEPTPIFDLLPLQWRTKAGDAIGAQPVQ